MKKALISGITGQDGSYLAEFLLEKGYKVFGLARRSKTLNFERIQSIFDRIEFVYGDLLNQASLDEAIQTAKPDEVYNLASPSFVPLSWNDPVSTGDVTGLGVPRLLESIRKHKPDTKFYQASSSEVFGKVGETPQRETTPFHPRSPYGVAKAYGHWMTVNYRENHHIFACSGILFNHESPRRSPEFVTRKVTQTVAKIKMGLAQELRMGNLDSRRDWGFAGDYVEAMWGMLQQPKAEDFVIATGESHSVRELLALAFSHAGLSSLPYVVIDPQLIRLAESDFLVGDPGKASRLLGWKPRVLFPQLIQMMVEADMALLNSSSTPVKVINAGGIW